MRLMLKFTTKGRPRERGIQQGILCRSLAIPRLQRKLKMHGIDSASCGQNLRLQKAVDIFRRDTEAIAPEIYAEYQGIAEGLGMEESDYLSALVSDIISWEINCTTTGFYNDKGFPLLGKTDDISKEDLGMNVLEVVLPESGYRRAVFHFAGTCWNSAGMNEKQLAIVMTGIPGPSIQSQGLFSMEAISSVLPRCASVAEAVEWIEALPVKSYGFSLLIADAGGAMALIEKTALGMVTLSLRPDGTFIHTNYIIDVGFAGKNPAQREPINTNGKLRFDNAARLVKSLPRTVEGMRGFLGDRNHPGAIQQCGEDGLYTDYAVVFIPQEGKIIYWSGYPEWKEETLRLPDGKIVEHQLDTSSSCSTAFNAAEYSLRQHNEINDL